MSRFNEKLVRGWTHLAPRFLPFADAATSEVPMGRLLRLSLFQVSVGMASVLLIGTLNRVMIVELGVPAWLVAVMVSLPLVVAPFRALVGFRSDTYQSVLGWKRVPYLWIGTLLQFGGLAIMPFALIVLSGDTHGPVWIGQVAAALAFLLIGAGLHTTQTVGLALATDLSPVANQPRVVALLCMMLLLGMVASAIVFGVLLSPFSELRLIKVVQGAAMATMALNIAALWKQEPRRRERLAGTRTGPSFRDSWREFTRTGHARRHLVAVGCGTAAFSMEDILLEPYGGQVLHLSVSATTALTALLAAGGLAGFALAARQLRRGADPYRLCALGILAGIAAFSSVIFAAPLQSGLLFGIGTSLIGLGGGLFAHCTLTSSMRLAPATQVGLALGAWGAMQASAAGLAIAAGGLIRDAVQAIAAHGSLGIALSGPATGYSVVYHIEIAFLFATLVVIGPLVSAVNRTPSHASSPLTLA